MNSKMSEENINIEPNAEENEIDIVGDFSEIFEDYQQLQKEIYEQYPLTAELWLMSFKTAYLTKMCGADKARKYITKDLRELEKQRAAAMEVSD